MSTRECFRCGETCHGCNNTDEPHLCESCRERQSRQETAQQAAEAIFVGLTDEQRVCVMASLRALWCVGCGREQPKPPERRCQCQNDE